MKIETQTGPERIQLGRLLADFSVAMLTSADAQGDLISRPMAALELDSNGALWFFTHTHTHTHTHAARPDQLARINLCFSDSASGTYVSLSGRGQIILDRERIERLWTPFARPWFPDGSGSADLALLRVKPEGAEYWDAPHNKMVRMFAMAASIVAARAIGMGEHDRLTELGTPVTRQPFGSVSD